MLVQRDADNSKESHDSARMGKVSEPVSKWVARATRPFRSATRRPEQNDEPSERRRFLLRATALAFHPSGGRAAQASGLCYPKVNFDNALNV